MSSIMMCDFCGTITGNMAAQVAIRPYPQGVTKAVLDINSDRVVDYMHNTESAVSKDACSECVAQLMVRPKAQLQGGKDETSPFGTVT